MEYINQDKLKDDVQRASDEARRKAEDMKQMAQERYQQVKQQAREKRAKMNQYIRENPENSMWMALGAGMVIGTLLSMAMRKKRWRCRNCG